MIKRNNTKEDDSNALVQIRKKNNEHKRKIDINTSPKHKIIEYHITVYKMFRHKISVTIL